jgi:hypothetical protein
MEQNLIYHSLHCIMGIFICDLLFNYVDIYLYLVIDNKILNNLIKSNA